MKVSVWKRIKQCSFDELIWQMNGKKRKTRGGKINFNLSGTIQAREK